jgi:hypothetical protein
VEEMAFSVRSCPRYVSRIVGTNAPAIIGGSALGESARVAALSSSAGSRSKGFAGAGSRDPRRPLADASPGGILGGRNSVAS